MDDSQHVRTVNGEPYVDAATVVELCRHCIRTGEGDVPRARVMLAHFLKIERVEKRLRGCKREGRGDDDLHVQELRAEHAALVAQVQAGRLSAVDPVPPSQDSN